MAEALFYDSISKLYDYIFPLNKAQLKFILDHSKGKDHILDIGCATGSLSIELSHHKKEVCGIDLNENMIKIAKDKALTHNSKATFNVQDMTKIESAFSDKRFDTITCLGNTLVHLISPRAIESWIKSAQNILSKDGIIIIQIINYDRIIKHQIKSLPTIENEFIKFERIYGLDNIEEKIDFTTILTDKKSNIKTESNVPLFPLTSTLLYKFLDKARCEVIDSFGSFDGSSYSESSQPLIIVAKKI